MHENKRSEMLKDTGYIQMNPVTTSSYITAAVLKSEYYGNGLVVLTKVYYKITLGWLCGRKVGKKYWCYLTKENRERAVVFSLLPIGKLQHP